MTRFITRCCFGSKSFEVIIRTDSEEHYKATQDFARRLIDHGKPRTNGDWIRSLSDEELADILMGNADLAEQIPFCQNLPECQAMLDGDEIIPEARCAGCMLTWLKQTVEDESDG